MIDMAKLTQSLMPRHLKEVVRKMEADSHEEINLKPSLSKEEFLTLLKGSSSKDLRKILRNITYIDDENLDSAENHFSQLARNGHLSTPTIQKSIARKLQHLQETHHFDKLWKVIRSEVEKTPSLDFIYHLYNSLCEKQSTPLLQRLAADGITEANSKLVKNGLNRNSNLMTRFFFRIYAEWTPILLDKFEVLGVWADCERRAITSNTLPFYDKLIGCPDFKRNNKYYEIMTRLSITYFKNPSSFYSMSDRGKVILRSWLNKESLIKAFEKAVGMQDRKVFWPKYSETVLSVYYSPRPNDVVIMEFENHIIIEFVKNANACFMYPKELVDGSPKLKKAYETIKSACQKYPELDETSLSQRVHQIQQMNLKIEDLKMSRSEYSFSHHTSWEQKFSEELFSIGRYRKNK